MSVVAAVIAILLVFINGFFVAVEFAFTAARRPALEERAAAGSRVARWALAAMDELPVTFAGAQLGVAAASLGLGYVLEATVERSFEGLYESLGLPRGSIAALALISALLIVSFVHNVIGEMAPKNATISAPERAALLLAAPFHAYVLVFRPVILLLSGAANLVLRLLKVTPRQTVETSQSAEDIAVLVKSIGAGGVINARSSRLLTSALKFQGTTVDEVMAPRPDLIALPASATPVDFEKTVVATGHSRIPVFGEDLDDVLGFIHAKDLMSVAAEHRDLPLDSSMIRHIPIVPETMSVAPLMEMMRNEGVHLAVAVDEHGSVAGLVTLEDIAEELVGDIRDEHDIREIMEIRPAGRDRYLVAGQTRVDRLSGLGVDIPEGEYETVGGYLMDALGRVPRHGDRVETDRFEIGVRRMDGRRVREVELRINETTGDPAA